jgi:hypothetical protein
MDVVTDLTAEAVSYITLIQDIYKTELMARQNTLFGTDYIWNVLERIGKPSDESLKAHQKRISELVWSNPTITDPKVKSDYFIYITIKLLHWLNGSRLQEIFFGEKSGVAQMPDLWASPSYWRTKIKHILYKQPEKRNGLAHAINYMPVQVIYALCKKKPRLYQQRVYQFYFLDQEPLVDVPFDYIQPSPNMLLTKSDLNIHRQFWLYEKLPISIAQERTRKPQPYPATDVTYVLENDKARLELLNNNYVSIPFETLFNDELDEIEKSRKLKEKIIEIEELPQLSINIQSSANPDPERRADEMNLCALALSGGGIRSATFNLGLLQKLAEIGVLPKLDYLSTVSGGGYIGTWLTSWIKREGSFQKVNDRLDKTKSTDPLAEDVRPIRWLRMFSNYLAPNASIMSTDAWTSGITWLRNTLINQFILLLLLLTVLSAINMLYDGWVYLGNFEVQMHVTSVLFWSFVITGVGAFLAGSGMRTYGRSYVPQRKFLLGKSYLLAHFLVAWAALSSFAITVWFFTTAVTNDFGDKVILLAPAAAPCFVWMMFIALWGRYHWDSASIVPTNTKPRLNTVLLTGIVFSTLTSSAIGVVLLASVWQCIQWMSNQTGLIDEFPYKLVLVFGVPLVLEAISVTVVIRMALMGGLFPDERREWWGRMGALVHRFILFWVLITAAALMLTPYFKCYDIPGFVGRMPTLVGGWSVIIGFAVKLAYQSKSPNGQPGSFGQQAQEIFIRIAPYLFMIGFLLLGAYMLEIFDEYIFYRVPNNLMDFKYMICTAILAIVTAVLSWRVGVNQFSLHDFYRNRLVRAYMGATRRRTDRENTANTFTGFDKNDDFPLALLRVSEGYLGPLPMINTSLNATTVSELDRQDRKAESFLFTPLYCGFDFNPTRSSSYTRNQVYEYGYRPTAQYSQAGGPLAGTAMAISGAAANPNMGYHSSSATAFLLTMFNVRLGRWIGNPRLDNWRRSDPKSGVGYLIKDLIGKSDIDADYVCLSDGGHFDNMGLYELIRRRCRLIVLGDAESDEQATCEGLANAIRRCRIDFGVDIKINVKPITIKIVGSTFVSAHIVAGEIYYPGAVKPGRLIYIKSSLTGDEDVDIREYALNNPAFPQQSTGDQFFDESQFESYRKLGYHSLADLAEFNNLLTVAV